MLEKEVAKSGILGPDGMPLSSKKEKPIHVTEDIDFAMQQKGYSSQTKPTTRNINVYDAKEGDTIEVCPEASMLIQDIIMWLEETKGENEILE